MMPKKISELKALGLQPNLDQELTTVWRWLERQGMTAQGRIMDVQPVSLNVENGECYIGESVAIAKPTQRHPSRRKTKEELQDLKWRYKEQQLDGIDHDSVWKVTTKPNNALRTLEWGLCSNGTNMRCRTYPFGCYTRAIV